MAAINQHTYRKLKRLFDNRHTVNGRDEYLRGLVGQKVYEAALLEEITRRAKV
jgi:hypothetical protein